MKRVDYKAFYQISEDFSQAEVRKIMPMLVPVKECEHGNIDPHDEVLPGDPLPRLVRCRGAGIGDDE